MNASNICHLFLIIFSISLIVTSNAFNFTLPDIPASAPRLSENETRGPWDGFKNFTGCHAGQNPDGLSKLKQYFNDFGYIPKGGNFTDDFDEEFESALKTYQKNFNLNQTGMLDNSTLNQIQRPRCGNADIVNGTSTMNSGKTSTYNKTSHFHNVGHYTFFQGQPRWSKDELSYAFLSDNNLSNETKAVFTRAFARWAEVIPMNFTETDNYDFADIRIGFYKGDHGDGYKCLVDGWIACGRSIFTCGHVVPRSAWPTKAESVEPGDYYLMSPSQAVPINSEAITGCWTSRFRCRFRPVPIVVMVSSAAEPSTPALILHLGRRPAAAPHSIPVLRLRHQIISGSDFAYRLASTSPRAAFDVILGLLKRPWLRLLHLWSRPNSIPRDASSTRVLYYKYLSQRKAT
ncbi:hypothetical protein ACFE04_024758 [Oxalis oulophora]